MAKILVVEDDADVAQMLARRLRTFGHEVVTAPSARLALNSVGLDFPIEIAVLDVNLPGTNGFELLEQLRRHPELMNPHLPAVFLSASVSMENRQRAHAMGSTYLTKPFVSGELQGAILSALGAVPSEAGA